MNREQIMSSVGLSEGDLINTRPLLNELKVILKENDKAVKLVIEVESNLEDISSELDKIRRETRQ